MVKIVLMECIDLPSSNQYLPEPFKVGEKVLFVSDIGTPGQPESFNAQFVKLKRLKSKSIQVECRKHFKVLGKQNT